MSELLDLRADLARVYRALVSVPSGSPAEIAAALQTTEVEAGDLLEELVSTQLADRRDGPRYAARSPTVTLEPQLLAREEELRRTRASVEALAATFREAARVGGVGAEVELVEGREEIQRRLVAMQLNATEEYLTLVRSRYVVLRPGESPRLKAASVRGVFDMDVLQDRSFRDLVRDSTQPNYENRVYPGVPMRLGIADRRVALVGVSPQDDRPAMLYVRAESLILALRTYFETIWSAAAPMLLGLEGRPEPGTVPEPDGLSERERELVSMLLSGLTNDAIAAHWRISRRSVVRLIQDLMTRTGSTSRVHLGWEAHRRGWLSPDGGSPTELSP